MTEWLLMMNSMNFPPVEFLLSLMTLNFSSFEIKRFVLCSSSRHQTIVFHVSPQLPGMIKLRHLMCLNRVN